MAEFYKFASDNPILTFFIVTALIGLIIRIIPWSKKDDWMD